jgi:hypothetical protein
MMKQVRIPGICRQPIKTAVKPVLFHAWQAADAHGGCTIFLWFTIFSGRQKGSLVETAVAFSTERGKR